MPADRHKDLGYESPPVYFCLMQFAFDYTDGITSSFDRYQVQVVEAFADGRLSYANFITILATLYRENDRLLDMVSGAAFRRTLEYAQKVTPLTTRQAWIDLIEAMGGVLLQGFLPKFRGFWKSMYMQTDTEIRQFCQQTASRGDGCSYPCQTVTRRMLKDKCTYQRKQQSSHPAYTQLKSRHQRLVLDHLDQFEHMDRQTLRQMEDEPLALYYLFEYGSCYNMVQEIQMHYWRRVVSMASVPHQHRKDEFEDPFMVQVVNYLLDVGQHEAVLDEASELLESIARAIFDGKWHAFSKTLEQNVVQFRSEGLIVKEDFLVMMAVINHWRQRVSDDLGSVFHALHERSPDGMQLAASHVYKMLEDFIQWNEDVELAKQTTIKTDADGRLSLYCSKVSACEFPCNQVTKKSKKRLSRRTTSKTTCEYDAQHIHEMGQQYRQQAAREEYRQHLEPVTIKH